MGVVAPNGIGVPAFRQAIRAGQSGIRRMPEFTDYDFGCRVGGWPILEEGVLDGYLPVNTLKAMKSTSIIFGCVAAIEAWKDAGLTVSPEETDWQTGCVFGLASTDSNVICYVGDMVNRADTRWLGTRIIEQCMVSGVAAYVSGLLGLGNQITANSSACATGTESILLAFDRIQQGYADRMVAGSAEALSRQVWGAFDAMRIMTRKSNDNPEAASRPMSATAAGFVPAAGAGVLVLEEREMALARGARIYAEIKGGYMNSGGQRGGGTMTAPNREGVQRCIEQALRRSNTPAHEVDLISGHLTSTFADKVEVNNWATVLNRWGSDFPYINAPKSMIGHCVGAAGTVESIASVLQLHEGFVHPSLNAEDVHPEIAAMIDPSRIPSAMITTPLNTVVKANFGFGDVNACIVFSKHN
jgi:3-oxoacyl-(acyl-carrier-protein) synthase